MSYKQLTMTCQFRGKTEKEVCEAFEDATDCANVFVGMQPLDIVDVDGEFIPRPAINRLSIWRTTLR